MSPTPDQNKPYKSMLHRLATEELKFCCMFSFIRETNRWSQAKVSQAMGVSSQAIRYWRDKKINGQLVMCSHCRNPQTHLELKKTESGRVYFKKTPFIPVHSP